MGTRYIYVNGCFRSQIGCACGVSQHSSRCEVVFYSQKSEVVMVRRDAMELFVEPLRCSKSDDRRGRRNSQCSRRFEIYLPYQSSSFTSPCGLTDDAAVAAAAVSLLTWRWWRWMDGRRFVTFFVEFPTYSLQGLYENERREGTLMFGRERESNI